MTTLREARDTGKLAAFIAEREAEAVPHGDEQAFNRALASMVRTTKEAPEASPLDCSDD